MPRQLTASERSGFFWRNPSVALTTPFLPEEGKLVSDSQLGCVLLYKKTDGVLLTLSVSDIYPNCNWNEGPSKISAFLQEFANQIGSRSKDFFDYTSNIVFVVVLILAIYFVATGNLTKLLKEIK